MSDLFKRPTNRSAEIRPGGKAAPTPTFAAGHSIEEVVPGTDGEDEEYTEYSEEPTPISIYVQPPTVNRNDREIVEDSEEEQMEVDNNLPPARRSKREHSIATR